MLRGLPVEVGALSKLQGGLTENGENLHNWPDHSHDHCIHSDLSALAPAAWLSFPLQGERHVSQSDL